MKKLIMIISLVFTGHAFAKGKSGANLMAVGQGISSPAIHAVPRYSNGFTSENSVGASYQHGLRVGLEYDMDSDDADGGNDGYGASLGGGNGQYGVALGYYQPDCDNCDSQMSYAASGIWGSFGAGLAAYENRNSLSLLFNPYGMHRIGVVADVYDSDIDLLDSTLLGVGYSFVNSKFTFSVDASKADYKDESVEDDLILLSPGFSFRFNWFQIAVTHNTAMNKPDSYTGDDETWFGIGFGDGVIWHLALYADHNNDANMNLTFNF